MPLADAVRRSPEKVLLPAGLDPDWISPDRPVPVVLAAGMGRRFGGDPKCIQRVGGRPAALHSIEAARRLGWGPTVVLVGHRKEEVMAALGPGNVYVTSENPKGGTAFAAWEALSVPGLVEADALLILSMGDKVMTPRILIALWQEHLLGATEGQLTLLAALYSGGREKRKGRIVRDRGGEVVKILEQASFRH